MLGLPSETQFKKMYPKIPQDQLEHMMKIDNIPKKNLKDLLPQKYLHDEDGSLKRYMKNAVDLINVLLVWDPSKRISCTEALEHKFFKE